MEDAHRGANQQNSIENDLLQMIDEDDDDDVGGRPVLLPISQAQKYQPVQNARQRAVSDNMTCAMQTSQFQIANKGANMSLNPSSSCFVPTAAHLKQSTTSASTATNRSNGKSFASSSDRNSDDNGADKKRSSVANAQPRLESSNASGAPGSGSGKEKYHAGSSKWGKYKKKEQEAKKRRGHQK